MAVASYRAVGIGAVETKVPVVGLYSSAVSVADGDATLPVLPPATSTSPLSSKVAVAPMSPVERDDAAIKVLSDWGVVAATAGARNGTPSTIPT